MSKAILPPTWNVPEVFRHRLGDQVGRQRMMVAEGHLLLVLHAPPKADDSQRVGRFFWRTPEGQWTSKGLGSGINAINRHIDEFADIVAALDTEEEEAKTADDYFSVLERLAPVYRAARNLHYVLQEARQACPDHRELINLRDRAYDVERSAELLFEGTKNALDFAVARKAEEQAHASHRMAVSAHRLNILAAFFFPIATLTALFGVNLRTGLEEASPPFPFVGVIGCGLVLGAILTAFITKIPDRQR